MAQSGLTGLIHTIHTNTGETLKGFIQPYIPIVNGKAPIIPPNAQSSTYVFPTAGTSDWGNITPEMANKATQPLHPAPIRVQMGYHAGKNKGFGWLHAHDHEAEIKAEGWKNIGDYLENTLKHFDEIWLQPNGRLLLVKHANNKEVAIVELQPKQDFYGLTTAYIERKNKNFSLKSKLIWKRN